MRWMALVVALSCVLLIGAKPRKVRVAAEEPVTDVKTLEARVAETKAELDKARAAAVAQWQGNPEYLSAKSDLDTKRSQLNAVRRAGTDKERADAEAAFLQAKFRYDKLTTDLEGADDAIVAAKVDWEDATKDLADFRRQLSDTTKPLEGVRAIVSALPREYWPIGGGGWTKLQEKTANKWLADNLDGRRMRVNGTAGSVDQQRGGKGAVIRFQRLTASMGERSLKADVSALFPQGQVAVVRKVLPGKPIAVEGSIRVVHMRWNKEGIDMDVSVGYSTLTSK